MSVVKFSSRPKIIALLAFVRCTSSKCKRLYRYSIFSASYICQNQGKLNFYDQFSSISYTFCRLTLGLRWVNAFVLVLLFFVLFELLARPHRVISRAVVSCKIHRYIQPPSL